MGNMVRRESPVSPLHRSARGGLCWGSSIQYVSSCGTFITIMNSLMIIILARLPLGVQDSPADAFGVACALVTAQWS